MAEPAEAETAGAEPYGFGDPIGWFRDEPARIFAVLATAALWIVAVLLWRRR